MGTSLIGLLGVVIGIFLNELLRRSNRIANYSTSVFERRLTLYEKLFTILQSCSRIATEVIENSELTKDQRHEFVSEAIMEVAQFCDEHELYIDEELTIHCVSILIGVEDIHYIKDKEGKEVEIKKFRSQLLSAKRMIRKASGIADLDDLYRSIINPKYVSPIIEYYRELKKHRGIKGKWE